MNSTMSNWKDRLEEIASSLIKDLDSINAKAG